jgi:hypothetical protein
MSEITEGEIPSGYPEGAIPSKAHAEDWHAALFHKNNYYIIREVREMDDTRRKETVPTCVYCGSVTPGDFLKMLQTSGTHYSGSDWKYGWPHKFYVQPPLAVPERRCTRSGPGNEKGYSMVTHDFHKFYTEHMIDATPEELELWKKVAFPLLNVRIQLDGGRVRWMAVPGIQRYGDVP